ncbi:CAIB/BAIF family enzyme [Lentinula aciculospora]|uniref:CAIB/BAIF family enzyme n=1 Tax=Lentinula aciculospora TaxID=153920 RepID=A0A9W9DRB2_9AGAR|nr:CAIB/BAIF family enzyme [Lentinula aciculospora]
MCQVTATKVPEYLPSVYLLFSQAIPMLRNTPARCRLLLRRHLPVIPIAHINFTNTRYNASQASAEALSGIPPPLAGIKIVDLTRVLAGPTATMLLADLGADVVKIEHVGRGDDTRSWNPPSAPLRPQLSSYESLTERAHSLPPESAYFLSSNRNKRSITVNFKDPTGLEIVYKLIEQADVLVENYIPGKLAKLGLGWEQCHKINPRLIYASITGYGQTGPYRQHAGYDVIVEGEAGLMHITGEPYPAKPVKVGVAATDVATGLYTHGAVMAALIGRQKTGKGCWIDCNLFETQVAGLANIASNYLIAGQEAQRFGTAHPSVVPYQVFSCKAPDGQEGDDFIMIGAGNDNQFNTLCTLVLPLPTLPSDPRFSTNALRVANRNELIYILETEFKKETKVHWLSKFRAATKAGKGVPHGPINNIKETFEHEQAIARKVTVEIEHPRAGPIKLVAPAVSYNGKKMPVRRHPPWLGEHSDEILNDLGYSTTQVEELRAKGVI